MALTSHIWEKLTSSFTCCQRMASGFLALISHLASHRSPQYPVSYLVAESISVRACSVVSDSVRPHRWQPTKLPHPWDSPGKNTGVGCHFTFQCMKVKCESEVAQLCLTLSDPMDCSLPGSSVHGVFQARGLEWGAIAFSDCCAKHFSNFPILS